MGRESWEPTKKQLKIIRELTAKNATNKMIHTALGIGHTTWRKYRTQEPKNGETITPIKKAIENGMDDRMERIKNNCIDSLDLMTRQHVVREVKRTRRKVQGDQGAGNIIDTTVTRKIIDPNPTVLMFTSVNLMPDKFQSINKVDVKQDLSSDIITPIINWTQPKKKKC